MIAAAFWERRYQRGGTSGAGSRGPEAAYKAWLVRDVVLRAAIGSLIDYGAGDGVVAAQLALPAGVAYLGVEPSPAARALASRAAPALTFQAEPPTAPADLVCSLDVVFHLTEARARLAYFRTLFALARRRVLIYGTCEARTGYAPHVLHHDWRPLVPRPWAVIEHFDGRAAGFKEAWLLAPGAA